MYSAQSIDRILAKLDSYLSRRDYEGAEKHIKLWLAEARSNDEPRIILPLTNELMGIYRKNGLRNEALECAQSALDALERYNLTDHTVAATTYINCATVFKAFGDAEGALPLFERAQQIYERVLPAGDASLGGLYNNMALALVDLKRFEQAKELFRSAIEIMKSAPRGELEVAITYLNLASAAEAEHGYEEAEDQICSYLNKAEKILENHTEKDGYYAFVCEKCAQVFDYYGYFITARNLYEMSRRIYERD